jgi:hypothetical protein
MNKELSQKLVDRWPKWFDVNGSIQHTLMPFGFECGDGWFNLIWKLCEDLDSLVPDNFEVVQVKEKFGGLRFYIDNGSDAIYDRIGQAEDESFKTCEVCGNPGKVRGGGWISTLCDEHVKK